MARIEKQNLITGGALLLILVLAAYFRLVNVQYNPGWFTDEGTHLEIARSMLDGRTQYLAVQDSVLLFSRVPLFGRLLAEIGRLFGLNITTLRLLTGSLGVLSVGLLAVLGWRMTRDKWLSLTATFILAIFPAAIAFSRLGFSYNLLSPMLLLVCLGLWEYLQNGEKKWLVLAAISIGLGITSDLWMISYLPVLVIIVLVSPIARNEMTLNIEFLRSLNWRTLFWSLPFALLPFALHLISSLLTAPDAFLFDLNFVRNRLSLSLLGQIEALATNITVLVSQDGWIGLGFIGLLALPRLNQRRFILVYVLVPLVILGRSTALHGLGFHYFIPFLPFVAFGIAALLYRGLPILADALPIGSPALRSFLSVAIICVPLFTTLALLNKQVNGRYQTAIDSFLINGEDAEAVARYVNSQLNEDDLVISAPGISWMLNSNRADFQMSIAFDRTATPHLPADLPPDRWAFSPEYRTAEMIVVDNWWYTWGQYNVPGLSQMIEEVTTWPLVFSAGDIRVYQNPN